MKIQKYTFCRKFNWGHNFCDDYVIIVTSFVLRTQSFSAVFCPAVFFYNSQVLNSIVSYNIKVSLFNISAKFIHHTPVRPHEGIDCCNRCINCRNNTATRSFFINTFSTTNKLFTPNVYCWSRKILVIIYWTHLRLNGSCTEILLPTENK